MNKNIIKSQDIPTETLINLNREMSQLRITRTHLVRQKRDLKKKIYNLSQEIIKISLRLQEFEHTTDDLILKHFP